MRERDNIYLPPPSISLANSPPKPLPLELLLPSYLFTLQFNQIQYRLNMEEEGRILIREYEPATDREQAETVERMCEVGPSGEMSLFTDMLGDPLCRVRHSPAFLMLVRFLYNNFFSLLSFSNLK